MQLNGTIARQIVERAMKIIHHSVNVMDEYGRIIGSGDPSRLNERHEGAILAINDNRVVEIDHATAQQLKGVKPGINLPIRFQQQTIGVVGVSGDPALVRSYGELVKMTAELIVEQEALMSQIQWNKRHREELVLQLIRGSELNEAQLLSIAQKLSLDLDQPRIAAIVKVLPSKGESLSLEHLQKMVHLLEYPERDNLVGITSVSMNEIVVLKPINLTKEGWSRDLEQKRVNKLMRRVAKESEFSIQIALGEYFPNLHGLARSYQTAQATLESATSDDSVLFYQDCILPVMLSGLKQDPWRHEQLQQPLVLLKKSDPRGILLKTLKTYFAQNCDLAQTCQALHIHRNTLRYRLERIEQETRLNFNNISDTTLLYLALINQR
ncbi:XRE family transcriptional regulator [Photobacterium sanctipauli]|uniref:XRE family transcriptional regulator n=1 Tax=Photobacterium sanctipauli TaxID=1342794 RepID=A0A2T3NQJ4_9GAMM|nr:sugar diacid recognition domain-containing protein [Photobacterium sanctipauli]PSW18529.1 XRE family transcriptional regulator [Photobacterium sanctipauli]